MLDKKEFHRAKDNRLFLSVANRHLRHVPLAVIISLFAFALSQPARVSAASVSLSATPASRTINQGQSTTYTININRDNYPGSVKLSATNLPSAATASFNPNPTTAKSSILTITTVAATPTGTFQIKVSAAANGISIAPINLTLMVTLAPRVTISAVPMTQSIIAGQPVNYAIKLTRTNYDAPVTLEAQLPAGLTASFEPNPVYGSSSTMRIYSHLLPFTARDYEITTSLREFRLPGLRVNLKVNCGVNWAEQFGTTQGGDFARDVAVASDGSIYVAGDNFNPGNNSLDVWVAKYNANGFLQWFTPLATDAEDRATEIAVDSLGNVFVGGYTNGTLPGNTNIGGFDLWIAKYDSSGTRSWVRQDGSQAEDGAFGFEIAPDNQGGGQLTTFRNDRSVIVTYSFDAANGFLTQQTVRSFSAQFRDHPNDIALSSGGAVYVVGKYRDETNPNFPNDEGYLIKFDAQGNEEWVRIIYNSSAASDEEALRVVADASGNNVYVAAETNRNGNMDAWLLQYRSDNSDGWFQEERSPADDYLNALAFNNNGDLITAGKTQGVLGERNGGGFDAWVARRDAASGNLKWVRQFPVLDNDSFNAVAIDSNNSILLAGETVLFKNNLGFEDALLMRYTDAWSFFSPGINSANGLSPSSGREGDLIHINGFNFFDISGVRFNGIPTTYTVGSSTMIDAPVPPGASDGMVVVSSGCSSASSATQFDVTP